MAHTDTVVDLIENNIKIFGTRTAIIDRDLNITYKDLGEYIYRLTAYFLRLGFRKEDRIVIFCENSALAVIYILSAIRVGCAYVPVDPSYPNDYLLSISLNCNPTAVLTSKDTFEKARKVFGACSSTKILCNSINDINDVGSFASIQSEIVSPNNLAYIIYTSGSTGVPKGVLIEHRSLLNHTVWFNNEFKFNADDIVVHRTSISFDASVWEIFSTLCCGATLAIAPSNNIAQTVEILRNGATRVQFVPSLLEVFLESDGFSEATSIKSVFVGGEQIHATTCRKFYSKVCAELINLYGPSEATVDSTYFRIPQDIQDPVPIGRPILGAHISIVNSMGEEVPANHIGEIWIGGLGVGRGYHKNAALTDERFIFDREQPYKNLYKTGDIGKCLTDGSIIFLGRSDDEVKINGQQVNLSGIESVMRESEHVKNVAAKITLNQSGKRVISLFYERLSDECSASAVSRELKQLAKRKLPKRMVPHNFIPLAKIPLTPSGKLDRKSLPELEIDISPIESKGFELDDPFEINNYLRKSWSNVTGVHDIGLEDDFFAIGGDSLACMNLIYAVYIQYGIELDFSNIEDNSKFADFVRFVILKRDERLS